MTATGIPIETLLEQESWARKLAWDLARGDGALADDLVQGAYAAALTRPPSPAVPVRRWLAKVMRNLARSDRRGQANRTATELRYAQGKRHEDAAAHAAGVLEIRWRLQGIVGGVGEPYRTRIIERYVEGLRPREIASRADVSIETVKSQLARGLDRMRATLDSQSAGDRSKWMAAFAPLLRDRRGIAGALQGQGAVVGLVTSTAIVAGVLLVVRFVPAQRGGHGLEVSQAGSAAHGSVAGTTARDEHIVAAPRRAADIGLIDVAEGEAVAALNDAPSAGIATTLWEVRDGNRRRGVAWNDAGSELAVVNYSTQQVEIWNSDGRLTACSASSLHLSEIAMLGGTIWATHPGGKLVGLDVPTLEWGTPIHVGDPDGHWLTNGLGADRYGRIHVARGGDGTVQVFDPRDGSLVGQWTGVPDDSQLLEINSQSFALGYNQVAGSAVVAIGTGYSEDLESFEHRPAIRLNGVLCDMQFLADGSLACLVEGKGLLRFQESVDDQWAPVSFMPLPEYGPRETDNRVEKFAFGGPSGQPLAMGRWSGLTVEAASAWETSGPLFESTLRDIVVSAR